MEIEFVEGRVYEYRGVSVVDYEGLMTAESKGTFFNEVIKPKYPNFEEI